MVKVTIKTFGKEAVDIKVAMAAPRILQQNRQMVKAMVDYIRPLVAAQTPLGPGHFGVHLRDGFTTDVRESGRMSAIGVLKSPVQGYWREFGTRGSFHKGAAASAGMSRAAQEGFYGHGGERAFMTAHQILGAARRMMNFYYGGMANWWHA